MAMGERRGGKRAGGLWYATLLFVLLLILPSTYLGFGQWTSMRADRDEAIERLPGEVADSADRFMLAVRERFDALLLAESARPFWHFRREYRPLTTRGAVLALIPSPLVDGPLPVGIVGHFTYTMDEGRDAMVHIFLGSALDAGMHEAVEEDLTLVAEELVERDWDEDFAVAANALVHLDWPESMDRSIEDLLTASPQRIPLPHAAVNLSKETDIDCLRDNLGVLDDLAELEIATLTTSYRIRALRDDHGTARICATRRVFIDSPVGLAGSLPDCFREASYGTTLVQGFFLDPNWVLNQLPDRVAVTTIPRELLYLRGASATDPHGPDTIEAERSLYFELGIEASAEDAGAGADRVVISSGTERIQKLYEKRWSQFLATVCVLTAALGTGLFLLLRSVRASALEAARTRNFVAAVGHELRTPVTALRLYAEMLSEGWATDEEKRAEYHQRILRESERLELLVDRVMRKTRLETTGVKPIPTHLAELVEQISAPLSEGHADLVLSLDPNTPRALTDPEGVRSILENLVDNARKYAKSSSDDPIEVSVLTAKSRPTLEVSDRGPGVPAAERERIFDAFYRSGDEERRSAKGIGLGLHLAALHANAMGATIEILDRPGGGALFRVRFQAAPPA